MTDSSAYSIQVHTRRESIDEIASSSSESVVEREAFTTADPFRLAAKSATRLD